MILCDFDFTIMTNEMSARRKSMMCWMSLFVNALYLCNGIV
jgi:hypothetical protein